MLALFALDLLGVLLCTDLRLTRRVEEELGFKVRVRVKQECRV